MQVRIALDVPEDHAYITMIRQVGRTLLAHHEATAQDIDDVEAVVGELCANVTRHANSESGCFHVALEYHGDHVILTVKDQGRGFDPRVLPPVGEPRPDEDGTVRHGGFGLHLVRSLMDGVEYQAAQPSGTTVRAHKRLRPADTADVSV